MTPELDESYQKIMGTVTAAEYVERVLARRQTAGLLLNALPMLLARLADEEVDRLDGRIARGIREIEELAAGWVHHLGEDELLGQMLDETTAEPWNSTRSAGSLLNILIRAVRPAQILELGTSFGYSSLWMADAARHVGARITTVEYLPAKVEIARSVFQRAGVDDVVTLLHDDIAVVLDNWSGPGPDLVFVDPNKERQVGYLRRLRSLMRSGSIIITDNAFDYHDVMEQYVRELADGYSSVFVAADTHGTLISIRQ